jgi:hypothetical protein
MHHQNHHHHNRQNHDYLSMPLWGGKQIDDENLDLFDDIHHQFSAINLIDESIAEIKKVEQESKMRTEMQKLLELCLKAQDNKCDMKPSQSHESIRKLAALLETRLYQSAISFESYSDLSTLQSRMRVVLYHLKNQRQRTKRRKSSRNAQKRGLLLQQKMGLVQYERAEWLVHEIRQRKNLLAGQSCTKCQLNGTCTLLPSTQTVPFGESLPTPVRNLFFRTPFCDLFQKYPLERIEHMSWQHVNNLMEQAAQHMEEYDAWRILNEQAPRTSEQESSESSLM